MKERLEKTAEALRRRGFDAFVAESEEEAKCLALSLIAPGEGVLYGGSMTVRDLGLPEALAEKGCVVYDREALPREERVAFFQAHFFTDWFLMSANGISEDGIVHNIDGIGNRVAAMLYGPKNVLMIVGRNKLAATSEEALLRARQVAAPRNAKRFSKRVMPCQADGICHDCMAPDSICTSLVTLRLCRPMGRIKVILADCELGY